MSDTITILHMTLTFITSTIVAVLGYLKFQDRLTPDLERRVAALEADKNKKHKKKKR